MFIQKRVLFSGLAVLLLVGGTAISGGLVSGDHWLADTEPERRDQLERQLRGLDVAMMEIGYRFNELHFAGQDGNWPYAQYQIEKIDLWPCVSPSSAVRNAGSPPDLFWRKRFHSSRRPLSRPRAATISRSIRLRWNGCGPTA